VYVGDKLMCASACGTAFTQAPACEQCDSIQKLKGTATRRVLPMHIQTAEAAAAPAKIKCLQ
jgi:hypothetical protein